MRTVARHPFGKSLVFEERPTVYDRESDGSLYGVGKLECNLWVRVNWERGMERE